MSKKKFESMDELLSKIDSPERASSGTNLDSSDAEKNKFTYAEYKDTEYNDVIRKEFTQDSYNGPSLRDFILRLNMMHDVALKILHDKAISEIEYNRKVEALIQVRDQCSDLLKSECKIEHRELTTLKSTEKELEPIVSEATGYIRKYLYQALALTDPNAFQSEKSLDASLAHYAEQESILTAEKDRPDFVNIYSNPLSEGSVWSIQRTVDKTIPSTERYDRDPFRGVLPNFAQCGIYFTDKEGKREKDPAFTGYRHSSYPPIRISDDFERQKRAAEIVKSMLIELTRQEIKKDHGHDPIRDPIQLDLSSLTLLTPYRSTDSIIPANEGEHRQLLESYNAVMMYDNRDVKLNVDGKEVNVRLNATMFNAPMNPVGVSVSKKGAIVRSAMHSQLEKDINAQGMNAFASSACDFLKGESYPLVGEIVRVLNNKKFDDLKILKEELAKANQKLSNSMGTKEDYFNAKHEVEKLNQKIFKLEHQRMDALQKFVEKNRQKISEFLSARHSDHRPRIPQSEVAELFFQTLLMYVDGKIEPIQYGARLLLANHKMGRNVDFYCKSGEDRTGRMQNMVEELCIFYRKNGRYPVYDLVKKDILQTDKHSQNDVALRVNEFSVSRDITGANSIGARGLQITDQLVMFRAESNKILPARSGDKIGKMAKGVYSLSDSFAGKSAAKWMRGISQSTADALAIEHSRKELLKDTLEKNRGNVLLETKSQLGFSSRLVRAEEIRKYRATTSSRTEITSPIYRTEITSPTYVAHRLLENDLIVSQKKYSGEIVARIEKDIHSVKDTTEVPAEGLPREINEEIAIEQAFAMVNPPFNAQASILVLSGSDGDQVARIHAVLLVLQSKIPSLKGLEIEVNGNSPQPDAPSNASLQKKSNQDFINRSLSKEAIKKINDKGSVLKDLIAKQKDMKSVIQVGRPKEEGKLNMIEGTCIDIKSSRK